MVFSGEYEHTIDAKHRLAIPAELRARLNAEVHGEGFYLVPGPNGALWVWPQLICRRGDCVDACVAAYGPRTAGVRCDHA